MEQNFMTITYDDRAYVYHLAPKSILDDLQLPGQYALCLGLSSDEDGESNEIVGLVCFYSDRYPNNKGTFAIRWFFVLPEYRGRGYGHDLMDRLCQIAVNNKISEIRTFFPDIEECRILRYVFYEMNFFHHFQNITDSYANLGEIEEHIMQKGELNTENEAISLQEVSGSDFEKFYNELHEKQKHLHEYLLPSEQKWYDEDVSFVIADKNGDISAAILIRYMNEALEPILFVSNGKNKSADLFKLLSKALVSAIEKYGKETSVRLHSSESSTQELYHYFFSDLPCCQSVYGFMVLE